jgi:hypothetical protein
MMHEKEANATIRRMDTLLRCVACLFVALAILAVGEDSLPQPTYRTVLLTATVFTMCGILLYYMKLCKRMQRYDEQHTSDR